MTIIDYGASPTRKQYRLAPEPKRNRIQNGVVAIDGEGKDITELYQAYNLLYASNGSYIRTDDLSITPIKIFEWLLELPQKPLIVAYAFDYDVTMWLRKLPKSTLIHLWKNGYCFYGIYRITYRPGHQFIITRGKGTGKKSTCVWDQFRFYQQSFVASLLEWNVGSKQIQERVYNMKMQRNDFANIDDDKIMAYCADECDLLVMLTKELLQATIDAGVKLTRYDGAGAIANGLMRDHDISLYNGRLPITINRAVYSAYYGGRTEVARTGKIGHAYTYDINSAYPSKIIDLPCLTHARYQERRKYSGKLGIWYVSWDLRGTGAQWGPFPFRLESAVVADETRPDGKRRLTPGSINYPLSGKGWYYTPEIDAAIRYWGDKVTVLKGVEIVPLCDDKPFQWVTDLYYRRQQLKKEGNAAQRVLKLGINALYGKTAQSIGHKDNPPKYANLVWAGIITSGTRAQVYHAIMSKPDSIVSCATDGIVSLEPLELEVSSKLGDWEHGTVDELWIYQPGVASYITDKHGAIREDGTCYVCKRTSSEKHIAYKTRGFTPREVDVNAMQAEYLRDPTGSYKYITRRFIGIGAGLKRVQYETAIGQWVTMQRRVTFAPSQRFIRHADIMAISRRVVYDSVNVHPVSSPPAGQSESALYVPHQSWAERWDDDDADYDALVDSAQP